MTALDPAFRCVIVCRRVPLRDFSEIVDAIVGLRCALEVTVDSPNWMQQLTMAKERLPADQRVGIGTVISPRTVELATAGGADFVIAPHYVAEVGSECLAHSLTYIPGATTPTEVSAAWLSGVAGAVKLFPAGPLGLGYFKALHSVYPAIPLILSGGISLSSARRLLEAGAAGVAIGGGFQGIIESEGVDSARSLVKGLLHEDVVELSGRESEGGF